MGSVLMVVGVCPAQAIDSIIQCRWFILERTSARRLSGLDCNDHWLQNGILAAIGSLLFGSLSSIVYLFLEPPSSNGEVGA